MDVDWFKDLDLKKVENDSKATFVAASTSDLLLAIKEVWSAGPELCWKLVTQTGTWYKGGPAF